jgi:hypothetical protein
MMGWSGLLALARATPALLLAGCITTVNLGGGDDEPSRDDAGARDDSDDGRDARDVDGVHETTTDDGADVGSDGDDGVDIVPPTCGDGVVEPGEECEAGESETCTTSCGPLGVRGCRTDCTWSECLFAGGERPQCNEVDDDCDGLTDEYLWCAETPPGDWTLYGVWGSSDRNVWAVGNGGTVLHWDGWSWSPVPSGTAYPLRSIWGAGPSDVWAVGAGGTTIRWDGSSWTPVSIGTTFDLFGVWCVGRDAWVVGDQGTVRRWQDGAWTEWSTGIREFYDLYAVAGESIFDLTTRVWVVGEMGTVLRWVDGTDWSDLSIETPETLRAIHLLSDDDAWVVGDDGTAFHWNGSAWTAVPLAAGADMTALWSFSTSDIWATGGQPLQHWDGTSWQATWIEPEPGHVAVSLYGLWGAAPGGLWAVGDAGLILHYHE